MSTAERPGPGIGDELGALWQRSKPTALARIAALRSALDDLSGPDPAQADQGRRDALTAAHKLAGSLGMFGLEESSELAQMVNVLVESTGLRRRDDRVECASLLTYLQRAVEADR